MPNQYDVFYTPSDFPEHVLSVFPLPGGSLWRYLFDMQIYTKILIGMVVGVIIGLTLGPKSSFLPKDLYRVPNASSTKNFRFFVDTNAEDANGMRTDADGKKQPIASLDFSSLTKDFKGDKNPAMALDLQILKHYDTTRMKAPAPGEKPAEIGVTWAQVSFSFNEQLGLLAKEKSPFRRLLGEPNAGEEVVAWIQIDHFQSVPTLSAVSSIGTTIIDCLTPIGKLFMRLIKMVIVPLVFASLLVGVASLGDIRKLGRLGGKTLGIYLLTTAAAVAIGLLCANLIQPGSFMDKKERTQLEAQFEDKAEGKADAAVAAPSTTDNLLSIIPENPVQSLTSGDMLQIIFFALIFGIALTMMGASESEVIITFFDKVQQAMVMIIHMVMIIAPFGVAALLAEVVGNSGWTVLRALLVYGLTVLAGLAFHATFVYGGILRARKIPFLDFLRAIRPAQLVGFSTASSSAALPVSMECAEQNLGVSNAVSSFVLPLGSTVNMDGTALYQGVAAVFIAQVFNFHLDMTDQLTIVLTATVASIGAAGVPGAGMITLAMVLTAIGIPASGVALILGMDRLLDMFRTSVNITGDLAITAVMASTEGENIRILTAEQDAENPERGFEGRLNHEPEAISPETTKTASEAPTPTEKDE
jgi:Na+/H+-dicarboxylate symporter